MHSTGRKYFFSTVSLANSCIFERFRVAAFQRVVAEVLVRSERWEKWFFPRTRIFSLFFPVLTTDTKEKKVHWEIHYLAIAGRGRSGGGLTNNYGCYEVWGRNQRSTSSLAIMSHPNRCRSPPDKSKLDQRTDEGANPSDTFLVAKSNIFCDKKVPPDLTS